MEITISPMEWAQEKMSDTHLNQAVKAVLEEGYVILNDVIDRDHLDILRERMNGDSQQLIAQQQWGGAGRVEGHLQQDAPPFAPYVFSDIVANPFAIQVTKFILGEGLYSRFYSGNVNCPGSRIQPLHVDIPNLWPNMEVAHSPATLIINVALMDVSEENGSTELWPGTHLIQSDKRRLSETDEAKQREITPPIRANTKKGALLIRDPRVWHRGVPNHSNLVRHMLALIHNINWLQRPATLLFSTGCEDAFPDCDLDHNVIFTDKPLSCLFSRYAHTEE